jgi:hypothetical protein
MSFYLYFPPSSHLLILIDGTTVENKEKIDGTTVENKENRWDDGGK